MVEQVLVISRDEVTKQGVGTNGIYPIDLDKINIETVGLLPRKLVDNKKDDGAVRGLQAALLFPQILAYVQIKDVVTGKYLVYRRKGKEKGLLGKYSIGVGGHIDLIDTLTSENGFDTSDFPIPEFTKSFDHIVRYGLVRELREEIGLSMDIDDLRDFTKVICTLGDQTSIAHLGLMNTIHVTDIRKLQYSEEEFPGVEWMSLEELIDISKDVEFEPWSKLVIEYLAKA